MIVRAEASTQRDLESLAATVTLSKLYGPDGYTGLKVIRAWLRDFEGGKDEEARHRGRGVPVRAWRLRPVILNAQSDQIPRPGRCSSSASGSFVRASGVVKSAGRLPARLGRPPPLLTHLPPSQSSGSSSLVE